jgi:transcriptional regulator with XRE-family HTH domain
VIFLSLHLSINTRVELKGYRPLRLSTTGRQSVYNKSCYNTDEMERSLSPELLRSVRLAAGLTQQQAADRLDVSQAYLAMLESGRRPVTTGLASRIAAVYGLGPLVLPLRIDNLEALDSASLAVALASLGYPGFRQLAGAHVENPANVLLAAIVASDVEVRVLEALPWVAIEYSNLNWEWLVPEAKIRDAQNRLGFVVTLARQVAARRGDQTASTRLHEVERILDRGRLVREDTFCQASLSEAERRWLRQTRPMEALHWNLLTDMQPEFLPYAA